MEIGGHSQIVQFVLALGERKVWHCKAAGRRHARTWSWRRRGRRRGRQGSVAVENHLGGRVVAMSRHYNRVLVHVLAKERGFVSMFTRSFGLAGWVSTSPCLHLMGISAARSQKQEFFRYLTKLNVTQVANTCRNERKVKKKADGVVISRGGLALGVCTRYVCTTGLHVLFIITIPNP